tara:strand:+ start:2610 stop:3110 length:501 start_codon:yes stop_codon:yes gene_type:complete
VTIPEGATEVILSYVRKKAAEWTPEEMVQRVQAAVHELEEAAFAVPDDLLEVCQEGQEWSPLECIRHVAEVNHGTATRVHGVVSQGVLLDDIPPVPESRTEVLATHAEIIAGVVSAVLEGDGDPDADIVWLHPFLGELNWREWLLTLRVHSLDHARQLAALQVSSP